jgi:hypothetical protein
MINIFRFKHNDNINQEQFKCWKDNVVARFNFAVMETFLYRDYVSQTSTTTPESRLRKLSQFQTDPNSGRVTVLSVGQLYRKALQDIKFLDPTKQYIVNLPKIFYDTLDPKIKRKLEAKDMIPSDEILPNNVANATLATLWKTAGLIEEEINENKEFIHHELASASQTQQALRHRAMQGHFYYHRRSLHPQQNLHQPGPHHRHLLPRTNRQTVIWTTSYSYTPTTPMTKKAHVQWTGTSMRPKKHFVKEQWTGMGSSVWQKKRSVMQVGSVNQSIAGDVAANTTLTSAHTKTIHK